MAIDFSKADPLINEYYRNPLIVDNYNYKNSPDTEVFSKIESRFKINKAGPHNDYWCRGRAKSYQVTIENFHRVNTILKVSEIQNQHLLGMYLLHKEEMNMTCKAQDSLLNMRIKAEECMLYHATSYPNALSIAKSNIDWRRTTRSRFGKGAYFSTCPIYANTHSASHGAFVICKVLVQRKHEIQVNYFLEVPPSGYDTTVGNEFRVYTKYDDFTFYPQYIVQYS